MKYFSYDPEWFDFEWHSTAEDAKNRAQERINTYLNSDGWGCLVERVCWGEIKEIATQTNVRPDDSGEHDYLCDYKLEKVK